MKRWMAAIAVIVVVLGLGAAGAAFMLMRFDARSEIERWVEEATGRRFDIQGSVGLSFWPTLGFRAEDIYLANAEGGQAANMVVADALLVGVSPGPLLQNRVEMAHFVLVKPKIVFEVGRDGRPNWIFTPKGQQAPSDPAPSAPRPPPTSEPPPPPPAEEPKGMEFSLQSGRIENGTIIYEDYQTGQSLQFEEVRLDADIAGLKDRLRVDGAVTYRGERVTAYFDATRLDALTGGGTTPLTYRMNAPHLATRFTGSFASDTGLLQGELEARGDSLRKLAAWLGTPLGEGGGLGKFEATGKARSEGGIYRFETAKFRLDDIRGEGDLSIETARPRPFIGGRLKLGDLNFNPYLAPAPPPPDAPVREETVSIEPVDVDAGGWSEKPMDFSGLRGVDASLELVTDKLTFNNIVLDRADLAITLNKGYLASTLTDIGLYKGAGKGRFEIDARGDIAALRSDMEVDGVDAEGLLKQLAGLDALTGKGKVSWSFAGEGRTQKELMQSLSGRADFRLADGDLRGVNLGGVMRTIRTAMRGDMVGPNAKTRFRAISGSIGADGGVLATKDMRLDAKDASVTLAGTIDMGRQRLDLRVVPRSSGAFAFPFVVRGPWGKLDFESDLLGGERGDIERAATRVLARAPAAAKGASLP